MNATVKLPRYNLGVVPSGDAWSEGTRKSQELVS